MCRKLCRTRGTLFGTWRGTTFGAASLLPISLDEIPSLDVPSVGRLATNVVLSFLRDEPAALPRPLHLDENEVVALVGVQNQASVSS